MRSQYAAALVLAVTTAAAQTSYDGRVLEFPLRDGHRVDTQTGSKWNLLGEAVAGPLKGKRLPAVDSGVYFAFAWLAFNPDSEIVRMPLR